MAARDKELVTLICKDCGKSFQLTYGRYRRLSKDNHWRCKECQNIQRSTRFENLSEEDRKKLHVQRSNSAKNLWNNRTEDEYRKCCESQKRRWAKLTPVEKEVIMRETRIASNEYNRRPETRAKLALRNSNRWNSLDEETKAKEIERLAKIKDDAWDSLTFDQKYTKMQRMWNAQVKTGPTEFIFNNILKSLDMISGTDYYWGFNTYPYIHPEYFKIFGNISPISKEINFPYHT